MGSIVKLTPPFGRKLDAEVNGVWTDRLMVAAGLVLNCLTTMVGSLNKSAGRPSVGAPDQLKMRS